MRRGFTLIELMIIIAILGVAVHSLPLLIPLAARSERRQAPLQDRCREHLRFMALLRADLEAARGEGGRIRARPVAGGLELLRADGLAVGYPSGPPVRRRVRKVTNGPGLVPAHPRTPGTTSRITHESSSLTLRWLTPDRPGHPWGVVLDQPGSDPSLVSFFLEQPEESP